MTKTCRKCHTEKGFNEFYANRRMKDGYFNKCIECTKRDVRRHRQSSPRPREYDRERYHNNPERKQKMFLSAEAAHKAHPEKQRSRMALNRAVKAKRLVRPTVCAVCGKEASRIEGHHYDYNKPLEVVWCCSICHRVLDGTTKQ